MTTQTITGMTIVPYLVQNAITAVKETKTVSQHARHLSLHDYDVITRPFRARIRDLEAEVERRKAETQSYYERLQKSQASLQSEIDWHHDTKRKLAAAEVEVEQRRADFRVQQDAIIKLTDRAEATEGETNE